MKTALMMIMTMVLLCMFAQPVESKDEFLGDLIKDAIQNFRGKIDFTKLPGFESRFHHYIRAKTKVWRDAVISVYNLTVFPTNEYYINQFIEKGESDLSWLPPVLNENACARVHAFGDHCTPVSIAEYFYGLCPNTILFDDIPLAYIRAFDMTRFFIDIETKTAFSTINYRVGALSQPSSTWINSTQVGTFRFDDDDKIIEADMWNPLYSLQIRTSGVLNPLDYKYQLANYTCSRHDRFCLNTPHKQYDSYAECMDFMMALPLGEPDIFTANNVMCRHQHSTLIQLRPQIHCAHLGREGGGFCFDKPLNAYFDTPFFPADSNRLVSPIKKLN